MRFPNSTQLEGQPCCVLPEYWSRTVYYLSTGLVPEQEGLTTTREKKDGSRIEFPCPPASSQYQRLHGWCREDGSNDQTKQRKKDDAMVQERGAQTV